MFSRGITRSHYLFAGAPVSYGENLRLRTSRGAQTVPMGIAMTPVFADGSVRHVIVEGRDVSASKRLESGLRQKTEELERANNLMVHRELKMAELKGEIEALKKTRS